jgi:molybdate transport system substrate-binding protein
MLVLILVVALNPVMLLADRVRVAAASDLIHALEELGEDFRSQSGHTLRTSFGASGNLTRQILQGAPFDIFFSANEAYVLTLVKQGLTADGGSIYGLGHLAFFVPGNSALTLAPDLSSIGRALESGSLGRLAIPNPDHAPYGIAAREALQRAGLWSAVQSRLVLGENAAQAARFTVSGNVDAGFIPHAIAVAPNFRGRGRFVLVADHLYEPLRQRMVLIRGACAAAGEFFTFMQSPLARQTLARYGFQRPAGTPE